jgi:hypothetical protein
VSRAALGLSLAAALVLASARAGAEVETVVLRRAALPLEGRPVDVAALAPPGDGPVRIRISGTVSSGLDGSELDALTRWAGDARYEGEGPFVRLPPGARLVEGDPQVHAYVFDLPRGPVLLVGAHLAPLAMRRLVTFSELVAGCSGALEVEVLGPPPAAAPRPSAAAAVASPAVGRGAAALAAALALLGLAFGAARVRTARRRRRPELALLGRSRVAAAAIATEARALGPAFDHVAGTASSLVDAAGGACEHVRAARGALRRLRPLGSCGVVEHRADLERQAGAALASLAGIVGRLEETAACLAARRAGQRRVVEADELLASLRLDVDDAVNATREAGLLA